MARPATWSLAARLTAWYSASAFALILAVTGSLYWALAGNLDLEDDEELADKVRVLRAVLRDQPADLAAVRQQAEWGWAARQHARLHVRLLDGRGRTVLETPGMAETLPPGVFPAPLPASSDPTGRGADVRSDRGEPFRALAARVEVGGEDLPGYVIQAALDRTPEEELLTEYRRALWPALSLALVASALVGYRIARRGIRPVEQVAATARRIHPANLGERLQVTGLPAELADLAATFNGMLDRLEESFGRLSRFSADLAHELRTPVNNLRGVAEVALGQPRPPDEYREALGSCLEECDRLARLIDNLLFLARAEDPRTQVEREPVDVGDELTAVRDFFEAAAADKGVELRVAAPPGLRARLNRPLFRRAAGNLVANALAHTPAGGRITLGAAGDAGEVRVTIEDTGRGVPAEHLPHLGERFYRVDGARSGHAGVGLGLAIVKGIAELHGGTVRLASEVGRGTRVTLSFPDAPPPASDPAPTAG